ncbi:cation diffusion facilitator family transporter [Comamonas antarctica]|uniref:cation diffusion facilitator family transporter n=1 Tax=Comamonas antarctica TaxID=2743470 RepID=UPI0028ECF112|nr:cation diffusion facilitator family transporter [Comamonas antarctica]
MLDETVWSSPRAVRWLSPSNLLRWSVAVAVLTIVLKTLAWAMTGSVGLLSDALESLVNLAGAIFALTMVTIAQRPADEDHPYGHTKAEYFSAGFEGILVLAAALAIVWAAVLRLQAPAPLEQLGWGLALSLVSTGFNGALAWVMFRSARLHRSVALEGDARHLLTDVWTSVGVVAGLAAAHLTGWLWLDPVVAIAVALNICKEGVRLVWRSSQGLMDQAVEPEVLARIEAELARLASSEVHFDHIGTRRAGQRSFVTLHMHVPEGWTLGHAARQREQVEAALMQIEPGLQATIELLPEGAVTAMERTEAQAQPGPQRET